MADALRVSTVLLINGEEKRVTFRYADILLDVLRYQLGLTGAKPGCLNGDCGSLYSKYRWNGSKILPDFSR